jgi:hypothetical protein
MGRAARANPTATFVQANPRQGRWMRLASQVPDVDTFDRLIATVPERLRSAVEMGLRPYLSFNPDLREITISE